MTQNKPGIDFIEDKYCTVRYSSVNGAVEMIQG